MAKLKYYIKATATIKLLSGLHIGGSKEGIKIGGIDNPVIRHPLTNHPYIPGSSLKGRFRMALEIKYDDVNVDRDGTGPSTDIDNPSQIARMFGTGPAAEATRFIFRDSTLSDGFGKYVKGVEKIELKMDRAKMAGYHRGNRTQEIIAADAQFDFEVMMRIFEGDDEELFKTRLEEAVFIVEQEYLGGSGTRGYGKVKFSKLNYTTIEIWNEKD